MFPNKRDMVALGCLKKVLRFFRTLAMLSRNHGDPILQRGHKSHAQRVGRGQYLGDAVADNHAFTEDAQSEHGTGQMVNVSRLAYHRYAERRFEQFQELAGVLFIDALK